MTAGFSMNQRPYGGHRPPPGVWTLFRCLVQVNPNLRLELCNPFATHWRIRNVSIVTESVVPSWNRRGGCASRKYREAPLKRRRGGQSRMTTPSMPFKGCLRRYFLTARPPLLSQEPKYRCSRCQTTVELLKIVLCRINNIRAVPQEGTTCSALLVKARSGRQGSCWLMPWFVNRSP